MLGPVTQLFSSGGLSDVLTYVCTKALSALFGGDDGLPRLPQVRGRSRSLPMTRRAPACGCPITCGAGASGAVGLPQVQPALPTLAQLLKNDDRNVAVYACGALYRLSAGADDCVQVDPACARVGVHTCAGWACSGSKQFMPPNTRLRRPLLMLAAFLALCSWHTRPAPATRHECVPRPALVPRDLPECVSGLTPCPCSLVVDCRVVTQPCTTPALRCVANITAGTEVHTQAVIDAGGIAMLDCAFGSGNEAVRCDSWVCVLTVVQCTR